MACFKGRQFFLLWPTREPCSRSWSYIAHIIASHIWPTLYRLDGPSCDIDSGTLRKKDPHWIRSDWVMATWLFHGWLQHGVEVVAASPCEEEAMNPFLARFSCCLRTLCIHVESQWMIIGSRCIKDLSFEHEVLRGCAMPSAKLRLYQFFREQLPCCPWSTSQLSLVPKKPSAESDGDGDAVELSCFSESHIGKRRMNIEVVWPPSAGRTRPFGRELTGSLVTKDRPATVDSACCSCEYKVLLL